MGAAGEAYGKRIDAFLAAAAAGGRPDAVTAFHAVRQLPYASRAQRDPAVALEAGEAACTAKHLLLRDCLRRLGEEAEVETVEGDFAAGIPEHPSMPAALRAERRAGPVRDFHNVTLWRGLRLDATWPDAVAPLGIATNAGWAGTGDTRIAVAGGESRGVAEDAAAFKAGLVDAMPAEERDRRARFLALLTGWLDAQRQDLGRTA